MSTLWRPPALRVPEQHEGSAVSWIELFYDLVFVVAIANLGRRFVVEPSVEAALTFVALFGMLWWAWASITFLVDRYESNDPFDRSLAITQMLGVAAFAAAVGRDVELHVVASSVAASYTLTRLVVIAMYARVWGALPDSRPLVSGYLVGFGADTALWVVSIFVPSPARYVLWGVAMVVSLATPWLMRRAQARSPLSVSHLPERFGLFTILVLGECVSAVVIGLRDAGTDVVLTSGAAAGFVIATALWWIYFDNFEGSVVRRDPNRRHDWRPTAWIYGHFPLAVSLATCGAAMAHLLIAHDGHEAHVLALTSGVALIGALLSMALILMSTAGGYPASRHRRALTRGLGAVAIAAIMVGGVDMEPATYLCALAGVLLVQVVVDVVERARGRAIEAVGGGG
jgi:low temperature requirement protein LtrA